MFGSGNSSGISKTESLSRRNKNNSNNNNNNLRKSSQDRIGKKKSLESVEYDRERSIDQVFQVAVEIVQNLPRSGPVQPTYNDKLTLYSLFKQAVKGDAKSVSSRPGMFDVLGRAKYDAWKQREGIKPLESKKLYVENVMKILKNHRDSNEARVLIGKLRRSQISCSQVEWSDLARSDSLIEDEQGSELWAPLKYRNKFSLRRTSEDVEEEVVEEEEEEEEEEDENEQSGFVEEEEDDEEKYDDLEEEEEDNVEENEYEEEHRGIRDRSELGPYATPSQLPAPVTAFNQSPPSQASNSNMESERRLTIDQLHTLINKKTSQIAQKSQNPYLDKLQKMIHQAPSSSSSTNQSSSPSHNNNPYVEENSKIDRVEEVEKLSRSLDNLQTVVSSLEARLDSIYSIMHQNFGFDMSNSRGSTFHNDQNNLAGVSDGNDDSLNKNNRFSRKRIILLNLRQIFRGIFNINDFGRFVSRLVSDVFVIGLVVWLYRKRNRRRIGG